MQRRRCEYEINPSQITQAAPESPTVLISTVTIAIDQRQIERGCHFSHFLITEPNAPLRIEIASNYNRMSNVTSVRQSLM